MRTLLPSIPHHHDHHHHSNRADSSSPRMKRSGSAAASGSVKSEVKLEPGVKAEPGSSNGSLAASRSAASAGSSSAKRDASPPPPTQFRDIPLLSSALDDWRYHLMRLASHAKVDPSDAQQFPFPVKLNRKWPPKPKEPLPHAGDPVVDMYGKQVMVPAQRRDPSQPQQQALTPAERKRIPLLWPGPDDDPQEVEELLSRLETPKGPQADANLIGPSGTSNNATRAKAGLFQKRVREIYKASAAARKTHNEEAQPWILEDYETSKEWESRRKESRRGLKALQSAIKVRREGGQFPSLPKLEEGPDGPEVKAEEDTKINVASSNENHAPWIGKLEGEAHESGSTSAGGAMSHALFVFDERGMGAFRVVPVSRMYKFLQRPKHASLLNWDEAEKAFEHHQKARMGEGIGTYLRQKEGVAGTSATGRPGFRGQGGGGGGGRGGGGGYDRFESKPIFRHLTLPGMSGGGGDSGGYGRSAPSVATIYDRDSSARRNQFVAVSGESKRGIRVKDEEGTYGEIDFEEDFADDEERNEGDDYAMGEEETRELEQKIKREMARAEERAADEDFDDEDLFGERGRPGRGENDMLTGSGKQMKKIMKALSRREGNDAYDDDDEDRNPYASDDESDEGEESVMANPEEALRRVREEREREAKEAAKNQEKNGTDGNSTSKEESTTQSREGSRSGTPAPSRPAGGNNGATSRPQPQAQQNSQSHRPGAGHANVAQRAASPHGHSRQGSRSGSPVRDNGGGGTGTPSSLKRKSEAGGGAGKRMRTGTGSNPTSPGSASPRSASPSRGSFRNLSGGGGGAGTQQQLSDLEREIIQLVRDGRAKTTKELISHFVSRLNSKDASIKKGFSDAVTRVLMTKKPEGTLTVRSGFAD